jgi:hypothetical protein
MTLRVEIERVRLNGPQPEPGVLDRLRIDLEHLLAERLEGVRAGDAAVSARIADAVAEVLMRSGMR